MDEGVAVGRCKINRLLFANDLVLFASSQQGLQHALYRFSAARDQAGMKIGTNEAEVSCHSSKPSQSIVQASGIVLQQVETFK